MAEGEKGLRPTYVGEHALAGPEPLPTETKTRGIADLRLDPSGDGTLWAASAFDPDSDDGPFAGAVRCLGRMSVDAGGRLTFDATTGGSILHLSPHKVEAIDRVPGPSGGFALASDDENLGGSFAWFPGK
jgi:hypothetical protein